MILILFLVFNKKKTFRGAEKKQGVEHVSGFGNNLKLDTTDFGCG